LAFRESFDLRLAVILTAALLLLGAAAGTNGQSSFCKPEQTAVAVQLNCCRKAIRSTVAKLLAVATGLRYGIISTETPTPMRLVCATINDIATNGS